jgi:pimeloyl-ACP methyl ester carboxylesterase
MKSDMSQKQFVQLGDARVAYCDEGSGPPVLLLHGCPFASFVWRHLIPVLAQDHRCVAPDLLGLGDTETPENADWTLRAQAKMILRLLDSLSLPQVDIVGHDHGGALAQVLAAYHAKRVRRLVLSNAEAYDNWPSAEERPFVRLTQIPLLGDLVLYLWSRKPILRRVLVEAKAVYNPAALSSEFVDALVRANLADSHRRNKTRRFLAAQFEPRNNQVTLELLDGLRQFNHPTALIWGENDPHFGPEWAKRLQRDMPGVEVFQILPSTGHLLMEEQPEQFGTLIRRFLAEKSGGES